MSVVKLRKRDKEMLAKLASAVQSVKGKTSNSEVVGLALKLAESNMHEFLRMVLKDVEDDPVLGLLRNPAKRGEKTDARKIEEYLYN